MDVDRIQVAVVASTPGTDSNTYIMFDSTVTFAAPNQSNSKSTTLFAHGITRIEFTLSNSQAGTLKAYRSVDKGTNWDQVGGDIAVAANAATDINGPYDFLVDPYADFRISWVNGGTAQATWRPAISLIKGFHGKAA